MKYKIFLLLALAGGAFGQQLALSCAAGPRAGASEPCTVTLTAGGGLADLQWQLTASVPTGIVVWNTALAGKTLQCNPTALCVEYGGQVAIPDGVVANALIPIPANAGGQTITFTLSGALGATISAQPVTVTPNPPQSVSVLNGSCDVNSDGLLTAADVTFAVNTLLQGLWLDLNADTKSNVADLQIVINALAPPIGQNFCAAR